MEVHRTASFRTHERGPAINDLGAKILGAVRLLAADRLASSSVLLHLLDSWLRGQLRIVDEGIALHLVPVGGRLLDIAAKNVAAAIQSVLAAADRTLAKMAFEQGMLLSSHFLLREGVVERPKVRLHADDLSRAPLLLEAASEQVLLQRQEGLLPQDLLQMFLLIALLVLVRGEEGAAEEGDAVLGLSRLLGTEGFERRPFVYLEYQVEGEHAELVDVLGKEHVLVPLLVVEELWAGVLLLLVLEMRPEEVTLASEAGVRLSDCDFQLLP